MTKPVLLGMNNPISTDPRHALYPAPARCTGHRIFEMLAASRARRSAAPLMRHEYLDAFDRLNLVEGQQWSSAAAKERAELVRRTYAGRTIVVFGAETWHVLNLVEVEWLGRVHSPGLQFQPFPHEYGSLSQVVGEVTRVNSTWWRFPHPSGLNRWYNDEANYRAAGDLLCKIGGL